MTGSHRPLTPPPIQAAKPPEWIHDPVRPAGRGEPGSPRRPGPGRRARAYPGARRARRRGPPARCRGLPPGSGRRTFSQAARSYGRS